MATHLPGVPGPELCTPAYIITGDMWDTGPGVSTGQGNGYSWDELH